MLLCIARLGTDAACGCRPGRDFQRIRLRPGEEHTVLLSLGGENLGNMLAPGVQRGGGDAALRGRLSLEAGGLSVELPRLTCLLTEPTAGYQRA